MKMPTVNFFSKGKHAGLAYRHAHVVEFNETLMRENSSNFEKTVVHEIAHRATFQLFFNAKQQHGPEFKYVFQTLLDRLNINEQATTYHSFNISTVARDRQYVYRCSNGCEHQVGAIVHRKIQQGEVRICVKSKGRILAQNLITN